jgi:hypothetical protein
MLVGAFLLIMTVGCCYRPLGAAGAATDCGEQPDPKRDPAAYARWVRECEERRRGQVFGLVPQSGKKAAEESASLVHFRL